MAEHGGTMIVSSMASVGASMAVIRVVNTVKGLAVKRRMCESLL